MNMPGFTAQAALGTTFTTYHSAAQSLRRNDGEAVPSFLLTLPAHYADGTTVKYACHRVCWGDFCTIVCGPILTI